MTNLAHLPTPGPALQSYSLADYLTLDFPIRTNLISDGILPEGCRMLVGAKEKLGKTLLLTQTAFELASRHPWVGKIDIPEPKKVMIFQKEVFGDEYQQRILQTSKKYSGLNPEYIRVVGQDDMLNINLDSQKGIQLFHKHLDSYWPDVVFLDPISKFHSSDEDKASEAKRITDVIDEAGRKFHCAFVISHHFKKQMKDMRTGKLFYQGMQDFRGSSAWTGWADTIAWMNEMGPDKRLLEWVARHGHEEPLKIVLTINRKYAIFDGEVQDVPTSTGEMAAAQVLNTKPLREMTYADLVVELKKHKIGPVQARIVISDMKDKNLVYFVGIGNNRIVRLLTSQNRAWVR